MKKYRIKYWLQETIESGKFCYSGIISLESAKFINNSNCYEQSSIVYDEKDFPPYFETEGNKNV